MSEGDAPQGPAHGIVPCLVLRDPAAAADFYQAAFGAALRAREPGGREVLLSFDGSPIRLLAANRAAGLLGPESFGGAPVIFAVTVPDLDAAVARAVAHGAVVLGEAEAGGGVTLRDPFLHVWRLLGPEAG